MFHFFVSLVVTLSLATDFINTCEPAPLFLQAHAADYRTRLNAIDKANVHAQVSQDTFVYLLLYGLLEKQDKGYYLEIGSGEPIYISNSYFFEKDLDWIGTSIDISQEHAEKWDIVRTNLLLTEDATKADYCAILQFFPKVLDYLSLDVDCYYTDVLQRIPFSDHMFKVITIEHDFYRYGDVYRAEERQILESLGYYLLCPDVSNGGLAFEDWWIHPAFFTASELSLITSLDLEKKEYTQLIQTLRAAIENHFNVIEN